MMSWNIAAAVASPVAGSLSGLVANAETTALAFTGRGVPVYRCQNTGSAYASVLKGPDAQVVGRHFFSPRWEANDGSRIAGQLYSAARHPMAEQTYHGWFFTHRWRRPAASSDMSAS